jgi:hypothetical protein
VVSGGSPADPETPAGLRGQPPPFLGTAVVGSGGLTAAIDTYGDVVDLRAPGPGGRALIENSAARQEAGSVAADTGVVPRVRVGGGVALPLWRADAVRQRYLPGTNVVVTTARFRDTRVVVEQAATAGALAMTVRAQARGGRPAVVEVGIDLQRPAGCQLRRHGDGVGLVCGAAGGRLAGHPKGIIAASARSDRRWLRRARPLGDHAPTWARGMHRRSLLVLRALTDRRSGAVVAGARDGWAYVWPRDSGAVALAYGAAGYAKEARSVARFLLDLDLAAAARFDEDGGPVPGRGPQGDATGWVQLAARAAQLDPPPTLEWRDLPDYQERGAGDYLANAIAAGDRPHGERRPRLLVRRPGDPGSGLDSAAAWAVRPFPRPALYPAVRETLRQLTAAVGTRFGIAPSEKWPERDPWSAPTAWTAWSLAALSRVKGSRETARRDRRASLRLLAALRRSATPAGMLPERVDAWTGTPRSTTPLAWSHAFAILALRELWPPPRSQVRRQGVGKLTGPGRRPSPSG